MGTTCFNTFRREPNSDGILQNFPFRKRHELYWSFEQLFDSQGLCFGQLAYGVHFIIQDPCSHVKRSYGFCIKNSSFIAVSIMLTEAAVTSDVTETIISFFLFLLYRLGSQPAWLPHWRRRNTRRLWIDYKRHGQRNKFVLPVYKAIGLTLKIDILSL